MEDYYRKKKKRKKSSDKGNFFSCFLSLRLQEQLCKKTEWVCSKGQYCEKGTRMECKISQGLIKKAIVRKLIKAINPASGRAAGGDFSSKT